MSDVVTVIEQPTYVTVTDASGDSETVVVTEESVTVVTAAQQGPPGPPGNGDLNFTQSFTNATSVVVNHNLNKYPAVSVMDSAGDECEGDVDYTSRNSLTLTFSAPFSGLVTCN